jgi:hypothetical protein
MTCEREKGKEEEKKKKEKTGTRGGVSVFFFSSVLFDFPLRIA